MGFEIQTAIWVSDQFSNPDALKTALKSVGVKKTCFSSWTFFSTAAVCLNMLFVNKQLCLELLTIKIIELHQKVKGHN